MTANHDEMKKGRVSRARIISAATLAAAAVTVGSAEGQADSNTASAGIHTLTLAELVELAPEELLTKCGPTLRGALGRYFTSDTDIEEIGNFTN